HVQLVAGGIPTEDQIARINQLGANSVTQYNWGGPHREDYIQCGGEAMERINKWNNDLSIPYFPNATIGWDDTPRFPDKSQKDVVHYNTSPTSFAVFLQKAKEYVDQHPDQPKLITLFSWNEWIEGGYLLPDTKYGYEYLEAVKDVIIDGKYSRYRNNKQ